MNGRIFTLFAISILGFGIVVSNRFLKNKKIADITKKDSNIIQEVATAVKEKIIRKPVPDSALLLADINGLLAKTAGTYGVYVYELDTGKGFGINEEMSFPAASTVKVPLLMAVYKNIELGKISKEQTVTYTADDYEEGTGSIQYTEVGTKWTVAELAKRMMKQSDNVAKNMFFRLLGYKNVQNYINSLGVTNVDMSMKNTITPKDAATLLSMIYNREIVNAALSQEMLDLMVDTDFENRLPKRIPEVKVAHKIGTWAGAISDIGVVYLDRKPYVITVYSKGIQNVSDAEDIISQISKKVYDYEVSR